MEELGWVLRLRYRGQGDFPGLYAAILVIGMRSQIQYLQIMKNAVILNAHKPDNLAFAKHYVANGRKVLLHTTEPNAEIYALSKNPLVQVRFGSDVNLLHCAGVYLS